jgi:hypothetical protein
MAVAVDVAGSQATSASGTSYSYTGITVGASATALLVVVAIAASSAPGNAICHWDTAGTNVAMLRVGTQTGGGSACNLGLYGLINPAPGNKTLGITWTASGVACVCAISFTGTAVVSNSATFINFASSNVTGASQNLNVTSTWFPNSAIAGAGICSNDTFPVANGFAWYQATHFSGTNSSNGQYIFPSSSPGSLGWTMAGGTIAVALAGLEIVPAPAPTGPTDQGMVVCEW